MVTFIRSGFGVPTFQQTASKSDIDSEKKKKNDTFSVHQAHADGRTVKLRELDADLVKLGTEALELGTTHAQLRKQFLIDGRLPGHLQSGVSLEILMSPERKALMDGERAIFEQSRDDIKALHVISHQLDLVKKAYDAEGKPKQDAVWILLAERLPLNMAEPDLRKKLEVGATNEQKARDAYQKAEKAMTDADWQNPEALKTKLDPLRDAMYKAQDDMGNAAADLAENGFRQKAVTAVSERIKQADEKPGTFQAELQQTHKAVSDRIEARIKTRACLTRNGKELV